VRLARVAPPRQGEHPLVVLIIVVVMMVIVVMIVVAGVNTMPLVFAMFVRSTAAVRILMVTMMAVAVDVEVRPSRRRRGRRGRRH